MKYMETDHRSKLKESEQMYKHKDLKKKEREKQPSLQKKRHQVQL